MTPTEARAYAPHQSRVIDERNELATKLARLIAFLKSDLYGSLPIAERALLLKQRDLMLDYVDVLERRIALWGITDPD